MVASSRVGFCLNFFTRYFLVFSFLTIVDHMAVAVAFPYASLVPAIAPHFIGLELEELEDLFDIEDIGVRTRELFAREHGGERERTVLEHVAFANACKIIENENVVEIHVPVAVTCLMDVREDADLPLNHPLVTLELLDDAGDSVPGMLRIDGMVSEKAFNGGFDATALAEFAEVRVAHLHNDFNGAFSAVSQLLGRNTLANGSRIGRMTLIRDEDADAVITHVRCTTLNVIKVHYDKHQNPQVLALSKHLG